MFQTHAEVAAQTRVDPFKAVKSYEVGAGTFSIEVTGVISIGV